MTESTDKSHRPSHLHQADYPQTLALLDALIGGRSVPGYEQTDCGAYVDWVRLSTSFLSTTERAAVHLAQGCAILEWHGPLPHSIRATALDVVNAVA